LPPIVSYKVVVTVLKEMSNEILERCNNTVLPTSSDYASEDTRLDAVMREVDEENWTSYVRQGNEIPVQPSKNANREVVSKRKR